MRPEVSLTKSEPPVRNVAATAAVLADMPDAKPEVGGSRLLHRWFVEYNPLYLLSAALVLVGVNLLSSALAGESFVLAQLGVPIVAEVYGWALIGGAAVLVRIGLRRPAVMLTVLAALYQCDVTLHTVSSVYLGDIGLLAALAWWVSFVAKLHAMAWAMRVRAARSSRIVPSLGALGLVVVPQVLRRLGPETGQVVAACWAFSVVGAALWTRRDLASREALDPWGRAVLRRTRRVLWVIWGTAALAHATYWCAQLDVSPMALSSVGLVVVARFIRRPAAVLGVMGATMGIAALEVPTHVDAVGLLVALALGLRAWREPVTTPLPDECAAGPYRRTSARRPVRFRTGFVAPPAKTRFQMATGSLFSLYLAVWTSGWTGGALPQHALWLDVAVTAVVLAGIHRWRYRPAAVALLGLHLHHAVALELLALPATLLGWGLLSVGAGFVLLVGLVGFAGWQSWRRGQPPGRRPRRRGAIATE